MKIDFSRLDALRPTAAVPEGFEPVPEAETPFDSGYEAMYRAAWDFHLETDDRLRAAAGEAREEIWLRAAAAMGEKVAAFPDQPFAAALFAAVHGVGGSPAHPPTGCHRRAASADYRSG